MSLLVHRGGHIVTRDDLALVPVSQATDSYLPVPHEHLAETLSTIGQDILKGFTLHKEQYALARDGNQLFGVHVFKSADTELGLSIGFREQLRQEHGHRYRHRRGGIRLRHLALTGNINDHEKAHAERLAGIGRRRHRDALPQSEEFPKDSRRQRDLERPEAYDTEAFKLIGLMFGTDTTPGNCRSSRTNGCSGAYGICSPEHVEFLQRLHGIAQVLSAGHDHGKTYPTAYPADGELRR